MTEGKPAFAKKSNGRILLESFHVQEDHISRCPLKVGDTLTPNEMITLADKLLQQDDKGFITLSNSPEILAEQLFRLLFKRSQHVVILRDFDIFHLDILQAIPIMGDVSDNDIKQEIVDTIAYDPKVISKECNERNEYPKFRRGLKIAEKLRKKRLLVVNNHRRNFTGSGNSSDIRVKLRKEHLKQPNNNQTRRLESLGEYFDNIINIKKKQDETKESGSEELKKQLDSNQPEIEVQVEINEGNDEADSTLDGRRILAVPAPAARAVALNGLLDGGRATAVPAGSRGGGNAHNSIEIHHRLDDFELELSNSPAHH
ncbi:hypothetical protein RR48_14205 [Papilio machaon]|uniref:Uncharacterized protein n=1 Tax=Papilio machaon TaxID=76193 RepID=A0A194QSE7_PAPMA|nr:hypothetical protein RR48_14205 [Papilio machaon]